MQSFKEFLTDNVLEDTRNLHLEHIEDEILNFSYSGARDALSFLEAVAGSILGYDTNVHISAKWDGSPAIFTGTNPENGKFFVATKSLFNRQPKICYTAEDVKANHSGDLATKLTIALEEFSTLGIEGILQGDLMFTDTDLRHQRIDESSYVTFAPNTITYAVPSDSHLGQRIANSRIGVIFHTSYVGESISNLVASFGADISNLKQSDAVWFDDATYIEESAAPLPMTQTETYLLIRHLEHAEKMFEDLEKSDLDEMIDHPDMVKMIKMYTNKCIIEDSNGLKDSKQFVSGLIEYIHDRLESEKSVLTTPAAIERRDKKKAELHKYIEEQRKMLETLYEFQRYVIEAKRVLLKKLNEASKVTTFLETQEGYVPTAQEGFVIVNSYSNRAVKLVDRMEFSRANFRRNRK